jgi:hypothetical protein
MQLLFVGDTKNRVYVNNKQSLQELKNNIQIDTANKSRQGSFMCQDISSAGAKPV